MVDFDKIKNVLIRYKISDRDYKRWVLLLEKRATPDEIESVLSEFMDGYVKKPNHYLTNLIRDVLNFSMDSTLSNQEFKKIKVGFVTTSRMWQNLFNENMKKISKIVVRGNTNFHSISDSKLSKKIYDEVVEEFMAYTSSSMAETSNDVLVHIRKLQKESIIRNMNIRNLKGSADRVIQAEIDLFKRNMLKKYPRMAKMLLEGRVLKSRSWIDSNDVKRFKTFTLDQYAEFQMRTLLNIDITSTHVSALEHRERVVEFYLRDNRTVEDPNFTCERILSKKIKGKVLLALDISVASILGIMTVDEARAKHSMDITRHCRHSIRRISDSSFHEMISKIMALKNVESEFANNE